MNKVPNVTIVAANVQKLRDDRKRLDLFSNLRNKPGSIYLLSETGRPTVAQAAEWNQECSNMGLLSQFTPFNNTAIIWKPSPIIAETGTERTNTLSRALGEFNTYLSDKCFTIGDRIIRCIAVYVPSYPGPKKAFVPLLNKVLRRYRSSHSLVIGGDWNCVENPSLDQEDHSSVPHSEALPMQALITDNSISDAFRILNPRKRLYTNDPGPGRGKRRLDRIYLSPDLVPFLKSTTDWARMVSSTHVPVVTRLYLPGSVELGPSKFKLGIHIFESTETKEYLTDLVRDLHTSCTTSHNANPLAAWRATKEALLPKLQELSRVVTRFRRECQPERAALMSRYGCAMRARVDPTLAGPSSIFIRLRQVRAADLTPSLKVDGQTRETTDDMLGAARDFYSELYAERIPDQASLDALLDNLDTRISTADSRGLEQDYDLEDMDFALRKCKTRSSPGPDGLPVEFYSATWDVTGPIIVGIANFIARQEPESLPEKVAHLHLIPKPEGPNDSLHHKRPISLINTDERIISRAHNQRLAKILNKLIGKTQTGFVPERWIGDNIECMQSFFDRPPECSHPQAKLKERHALMAVMDFEKAYDRLSHVYMKAVLTRMGFGPRSIRWYMSTCIKQTAQIYLNGWISTPFTVGSGVRQGDPLAPSLFALFIEPFAQLIRKSVKGSKGWADDSKTDSPVCLTRELLFADDVACGLQDYSDMNSLIKVIKVYERASGSKLSQEKSFIAPIGHFRDNPRTSYRGWRVTTDEFRYLGVRVGAVVDADRWWSARRDQVIRRMRTIPMFDLPIVAKCMIINTYCYSMVLYHDRFLPAPKSIVGELEDAALTAIWGRRKHRVNPTRLTTPIDHGGFGLHDLEMQLDLGRAKWVYELIGENAWTNGPLRCVRLRLHYCCVFRTYVERTEPRPGQLARPFEWNWIALLCDPPELKFMQAIADTKRCLPSRWIAYVTAWNTASTFVLNSYSHWNNWLHRVLKKKKPLEFVIPREWFIGPNGEPMEAGDFSRVTALYHLERHPPIITQSWQSTFQLGKRRWRLWWQIGLRKLRRAHSDAADVCHLLSLNSLSTGHHSAKPNSPWVNNRSPTCTLCGGDAEETPEHLFTQCPISQHLWSAISSTPLPPLVAFVVPVVKNQTLAAIERKGLLVHMVWKLAQRRRYGSLPLLPILPRELRSLCRQLRSSLGRIRIPPALLD